MTDLLTRLREYEAWLERKAAHDCELYGFSDQVARTYYLTLEEFRRRFAVELKEQ